MTKLAYTFHSHTSFCDGKATMEEFVVNAIQRGFSAYGISSHAPTPFPTHWNMDVEKMDDYIDEFYRLKKKYRDQIDLYLGLEIDYLSVNRNAQSLYFKNLPLDYKISSVHFLPLEDGTYIDADVSGDKMELIVSECFDGDPMKVVSTYLTQLNLMIETGGFDFVGHIDKICFNMRDILPNLATDEWFIKQMDAIFRKIAEKGLMIEVNTKYAYKRNVFFPGEYWIRRAEELKIGLLVNSDAHYPERINEGRDMAFDLLRELGIEGVFTRDNNKWIKVML